MTKQEMVSYLTGLHSLMQGQDEAGVHNRSRILGEEYQRVWDQLKETITKEQEDEARQSDKQSTRRSKARADQSSGEPGGGSADRVGSRR